MKKPSVPRIYPDRSCWPKSRRDDSTSSMARRWLPVSWRSKIGGKGMTQRVLYSSDRRHHGEVHGMACIRTMAFLITALSMLSACATGGPPQRAAVVGAEESVCSTELAF